MKKQQTEPGNGAERNNDMADRQIQVIQSIKMEDKIHGFFWRIIDWHKNGEGTLCCRTTKKFKTKSDAETWLIKNPGIILNLTEG